MAVAWPSWGRSRDSLGSIVGTFVNFVFAIAFVGREYIHVQRLTGQCIGAESVCHSYPGPFTRFVIYGFIAMGPDVPVVRCWRMDRRPSGKPSVHQGVEALTKCKLVNNRAVCHVTTGHITVHPKSRQAIPRVPHHRLRCRSSARVLRCDSRPERLRVLPAISRLTHPYEEMAGVRPAIQSLRGYRG
jgi:hypothetical protein